MLAWYSKKSLKKISVSSAGGGGGWIPHCQISNNRQHDCLWYMLLCTSWNIENRNFYLVLNAFYYTGVYSSKSMQSRKRIKIFIKWKAVQRDPDITFCLQSGELCFAPISWDIAGLDMIYIIAGSLMRLKNSWYCQKCKRLQCYSPISKFN